jgi:hypothetical protein
MWAWRKSLMRCVLPAVARCVAACGFVWVVPARSTTSASILLCVCVDRAGSSIAACCRLVAGRYRPLPARASARGLLRMLWWWDAFGVVLTSGRLRAQVAAPDVAMGEESDEAMDATTEQAAAVRSPSRGGGSGCGTHQGSWWKVARCLASLCL